MSLRYIGSKARLADAILECVGAPDGGTLVDGFCGTGAVARAAWERGWTVHLNDHLRSAGLLALARLTSLASAGFTGRADYRDRVEALNAADPVRGFIWREYSPASAAHCGVERRYFTEGNAQRIDGVRRRIKEWRATGAVREAQSHVLIADLLGAANRVANTAGTYGCFLSRWQKQALRPLRLQVREMPATGPPVAWTTDDVASLPCRAADTAYFDPPYTKRQYAAYYHVLETIAMGDAPSVSGVCGIRPWRALASDYCYKTRALPALVRLVRDCPAKRVWLSYSAEGHVPLDALARALEEDGACVRRRDLTTVGRYRPNRAAVRRRGQVQEVLFEIVRRD